MRRGGPGCESARGYTYLGLLFIVAVMGMVAGAAASLWSLESQRQRERELLFVGRQYRAAIESYLASTPQPAPTPARTPGRPAATAAALSAAYPRSLDDLLLDPRFVERRRHLRRLYPDPMTGRVDWVLVRSADGGIAGVHSRSSRVPIKSAGFEPQEAFAGAGSYRGWTFVAMRRTAPATPTAD